MCHDKVGVITNSKMLSLLISLLTSKSSLKLIQKFTVTKKKSKDIKKKIKKGGGMGQGHHICVSQHPLTGKQEPPLKGQMSSALQFGLGKHNEKIPTPYSVPFLPFLKCN